MDIPAILSRTETDKRKCGEKFPYVVADLPFLQQKLDLCRGQTGKITQSSQGHALLPGQIVVQSADKGVSVGGVGNGAKLVYVLENQSYGGDPPGGGRVYVRKLPFAEAQSGLTGHLLQLLRRQREIGGGDGWRFNIRGVPCQYDQMNIFAIGLGKCRAAGTEGLRQGLYPVKNKPYRQLTFYVLQHCARLTGVGSRQIAHAFENFSGVRVRLRHIVAQPVAQLIRRQSLAGEPEHLGYGADPAPEVFIGTYGFAEARRSLYRGDAVGKAIVHAFYQSFGQIPSGGILFHGCFPPLLYKPRAYFFIFSSRSSIVWTQDENLAASTSMCSLSSPSANSAGTDTPRI